MGALNQTRIHSSSIITELENLETHSVWPELGNGGIEELVELLADAQLSLLVRPRHALLPAHVKRRSATVNVPGREGYPLTKARVLLKWERKEWLYDNSPMDNYCPTTVKPRYKEVGYNKTLL